MSALPTPPAAAPTGAAAPGVEPRVASPLQVLRDDVLATPAYAVPDATGLVKLDAMENPYPLPASLPEPLRAAFAAHLAGVALNRYPVPRYAGLKARLAARAGVPAGFELMVGNGSDEIIAILSTAVARPGATILAPMPGFVMYEVSARLAGARFVGVPLRADFALDVDAMRAAIAEHRPALTWLAYPNNPTGNAFDPAAIEAVLRAAQDAGAGFVVADEAYRPFADDSWMPRLADFPNLLVMQTVSKLGLAGLRLGLLAGRPDAIAEFDKVRPPYNVNVLTEAAADWLLEHGAELLDAQAATIRADRARLAAELAAVPGVRTVFPSQANFLLFRVDDPAATMAGLRARGVLIKDVSRAHPLLAGCLRVTVGAPAESRAFVDALRATLAG